MARTARNFSYMSAASGLAGADLSITVAMMFPVAALRYP
jgi:hypothetical protein